MPRNLKIALGILVVAVLIGLISLHGLHERIHSLSDGTAIADFSDALVTEIPSGIASEETAVDSIVQTLESNIPSLRRLKILIRGQETDTLAGHVDLTGFYDLTPSASQPTHASSTTNGRGLSEADLPSQNLHR